MGEKIRKILLDAKNLTLTPVSEMLLYMAARSQIVEEIIKPALDSGKLVICDRFLDSTLAYQGYGLGLDIRLIEEIGKRVTRKISPDLTILLDLAIQKGFKYRNRQKDRIEQRSLSYHARVRSGYLRLARRYAKRIKIVKVKGNKNQIQKQIRKLIDSFLERR